jgi:hypothetical protein
MADAKKMVEGWVFGEGAVMYPYLYDDDGKRMLAGAYSVGYGKWLPGVFKWYELGGTQGRHIHSTPADKVEAAHAFGVRLYDKEGRQTAYIAPAEEEWDGDELAAVQAQYVQRDAAMADPDQLERFLSFFDNE